MPAWLITILFYALMGLALSIVWFAFRDRFNQDYGRDRGPTMLALFLLCWPAFIIVSLVDRHRDRTRASERPVRREDD